MSGKTRVKPAQTKRSQGKKAASPLGVEIPVATHYFEQAYLYAFATQPEIYHHVRTQALAEESQAFSKIAKSWKALQPRVRELLDKEAGIAETILIDAIPKQYEQRLNDFAADDLFKKTFQLQISFELVELDKLVAAQRMVNLNYVDRLTKRFPKNLNLKSLLEICVSSRREMDPIQHLEFAPNSHVFSSPNSDIRFLGSFVKDLTKEDLPYAQTGGLPAAAIIAFVGYGGARINVLYDGKRMVLNNGFHRAYALRSKGVKQIPVVVQHASKLQLEFPPHVAGLPREYLLGHARPVLIKDFFEPEFTVTLKVRERIRMVNVGISVKQHDVPA